ncbi:RNA polymerase, sigma 32 subunit, RpoH [Kaistia soli DSM 19436]|uniref:RNA polymerase sigma factor n=1 Tax=Kaistia soli DSM 19436 TaxID=1122133 RepID=A0A1M5CDI8_9HYPH|nr:RNA polymerase, sigma 32 subunit, RpoH [Kaistia soli DSM 19436]
MAMSTTSSRQFVKAAMQAPYLEREQEHNLAVLWRDRHDQAALHQLTQAHMRLVIAIAARFRHFGLPMSDLIQEGNVGLLEAAARFEPEREIRFSTYATWWIRAAIQDYVLRNWSIVRGGTSSTQKALFFNLRRLRAKLSRNGEAGNSRQVYQQIALAIGVSTDDVAVMDARLSGSDASLNAPVGDGESTASDRQDFLVDDAPLPDERVGEAIDGARWSTWLHQAMDVLSPREARILKARRLSEETVTLEELGVALGISKERVRQIEGRAMEKVKAALLRDHPQPMGVS